uniref:V-set domain-containing T-cell activation inhibitor 1 n=1 Tax=Pristiophorus japonicus TaxID=55135 RepID=UPI00398F7B35
MMSSLHCLVLFSLLIYSEELTISSDQATDAEIGKHVTLKCTFDSVANSNPTVVWEKAGVDGTVYKYKENKDDLSKQHVNYTGRTELNGSSIHSGAASLTLKNVNIWDEGTYTCRISASNGFDAKSVNLFVWAQVIDGLHISLTPDEMLLCHSLGWYPAPEITWSDTSGNILDKDCDTTLTTDNNGFFNVSHVLKQHNLEDQYICSIKHKWMAKPQHIRAAFSLGGKNMLHFVAENNSPGL